jgi:hypothetical protein
MAMQQSAEVSMHPHVLIFAAIPSLPFTANAEVGKDDWIEL